MTEVKTLAATCSYKEEDNMIRDRIVIGIRNAELKDKLLSRSDLTMDMAEEICKTTVATKLELKEMAATQEVDMVKRTGKKVNINKNKYGKTENYKSKISDNAKRNNNNGERYRMNDRNNLNGVYEFGKKHKPKECVAFGKMCNICKKMNHFSIGCKLRGKNGTKMCMKLSQVQMGCNYLFVNR